MVSYMVADGRRLLSSKKIQTVSAIIFSGVCWYFSCDLSGDYWFLLWIAPIPVLLICLRTSGKHAFFISFIAFLIGRLSWLPYLLAVVPGPLAIAFTLLLPLVFALVNIQTRKAILKTPHWIAIFAFPALWTSFEYLMLVFSPDGTAGSIAYSQSNVLPIIQLASVIGLPGITFLVTLIPSALTVGWYYRQQKQILLPTTIITSGILCVVLIFGFVRINHDPSGEQLNVALVSMEEALHEETDKPDHGVQVHLTELYVQEVIRIAKAGTAEVVVLPEKALILDATLDTVIINKLVKTAAANRIAIVIGLTRLKDGYKENISLVISEEGKIIADYNKVNLFEGEVIYGFKPGNEPVTFDLNNVRSGVAICKDLDFANYIRKYNRDEIKVLYVPAWDFVQDDWLHSRMAILRGVENGYSIVRVARQGRLTVSDYRGKLLHEASSAQGERVTLTGTAPLHNEKTWYGKTGDWFAILNLIAGVYFIFRANGKMKTNAIVSGGST